MQNSDKASMSIILAGPALLLKMLITLERCGIFGSFFLLMYFNIFQPLVCKTFGWSSIFNENDYNT